MDRSLKWLTHRPGGGQAFYFSDEALAGAYPRADAAEVGLDLYNVHYCAPSSPEREP